MIFLNETALNERVNGYFCYIKGEYHLEPKPPQKKQAPDAETGDQVVWDRQPEPALLTGLALHLGFNSMDDFVACEKRGKHKKTLRKARLKIEAEYEKKLHQQAPTGAMFALRCMGWADKNAEPAAAVPKKLLIEITESGPKISRNEKEVVM
ncbi:hypothetical protein [Mucilaginibacter sp.]|uniref:hypothetical protein n=1 Tax=Mucilaginibacter sp. TaxID=1882438 RepID=UPI003263F603